jgi:hypothetical protein
LILLEELTETILIEEGTSILGLDFIHDTLGLSWGKIERVFTKCVEEYSARKPIETTELMSGSPIIMPEGTLNVKSVRYGVLEDFPRYIMPEFDPIEYNANTRELRIFPPVSPVKVTYTKKVSTTKSVVVSDTIETYGDQTEVEGMLRGAFQRGTLKVVRGTKEMSVTSDDGTTVTLDGTLGSGTIDVKERTVLLNLTDSDSGSIVINYMPKYKVAKELELSDYVFNKLFAFKLLEAVAALRSQATQTDLHNIDLTEDGLQERVRILGTEVKRLLKSSISFSAISLI